MRIAYFVVAIIAVCAPPLIASAELSGGVRTCLYVPGLSVPAQMPADIQTSKLRLPPSATRPSVTKVAAEITARQLVIHHSLWKAVNDHYVYPDFRGRDWKAIGAKYEALIRQGLSDTDFYAAMQAMLNELGNGHHPRRDDADALGSLHRSK